jgi:hypothetical protein
MPGKYGKYPHWDELKKNAGDERTIEEWHADQGGGNGGGDMLKSVYDTNGNGVVDNSEKLEGSTKAQVQDHTPKAHTLESHSSRAHSELTGIGANDHHPQAHTLESHSSKAHSELTGVGANDHHNELHASDHKTGGNQVLYVPRSLVWFLEGEIETGTEQCYTFRALRAMTREDVQLHVKTPPTGASLIVDLMINGVSMFDTKPEIDADAETGDDNHVFGTDTIPAGAEVRLDITQIGSGDPGADLTVTLHCKEAVI